LSTAGMTAEELGTAIANGLAANKASSGAKKGYKKWSPCHAKMVLHATETTASGFVHPETKLPFANQTALLPTDHYISICDASSLSSACQILNMTLKHKMLCDFTMPEVTVTALREGAGIVWDRPDKPGPFSCFSFGPARYDLHGIDTEEQMALHLAQSSGRGLSEAQVKKLSTLCHRSPQGGDQWCRFIRNIDGVAQTLFGGRADLHAALEDWIAHFQANGDHYEAMGAADSTFWAKLLFLIDRGIQGYLQSCMIATDAASVNKMFIREISRTSNK
jgi:hypothetical protein